MNRILRFVTWICSKFTSDEITQIIDGLTDVLHNRSDIKPKDDFKKNTRITGNIK